MAESDVARAIAFYESSDDVAMLRSVLNIIRPMAASRVGRFERQGREVPPPSQVIAAAEPATQEEALRTVRATKDFAALQAIARAIGRRIEELMASS